MRGDVDTILIECVFQPVSDRLCVWTSCFGLARISLAGAVILQFTVLAVDLQAFADPVQRLLAGAITLLALFGARQAWAMIKRTERQARPGAMNLRRITLRWQRLSWLAVTFWSAAVSLGQAGALGPALCVASLCWLGVIYFVSCTPSPPPAPRVVWRPVCA